MLRKISVKDLRVDMFIADLDRPWIDTPFPLQGFLIIDPEQLRQLREFCQWVVVDPERSIGFEYEAPPRAAPPERRDLGPATRVQINRVAASSPPPAEEDATGTTPLRPRATPAPSLSSANRNGERSASREFAVPVKSSMPNTADDRASMLAPAPPRRNTRPRRGGSGSLLGFFGHLKDSAKSLFAPRVKDEYAGDSAPNYYAAPTPDQRPGFIPENVQLTIYEDKQTVQDELAFASDAYKRTNEILTRVAEDIRTGNTLQLDSIEDVIDDMVDSMVRNPDAMMWVARMRELDVSTYDHGLNVAISLIAFGRHIGYPREPLSHLGMLGLLLDVGKIKLSRALLEKNGRLTDEEFALVKTHVELGLGELRRTPNIHADVLEGIAQHHERMNGSGYPYSLQGEKISIFGRMAGIADTYAAMTRKRAYADAASPHEVLQMLSNWSGTLFHPDMVEQFIQSVGAFPVGSMVELSTGEVAVIVTHNKLKRLKPKVLIITEPDKTPRKYPTTVDLIYDVSDKPVYIRRGLPSDAFGLDPSEFYLN